MWGNCPSYLALSLGMPYKNILHVYRIKVKGYLSMGFRAARNTNFWTYGTSDRTDGHTDKSLYIYI